MKGRVLRSVKKGKFESLYMVLLIVLLLMNQSSDKMAMAVKGILIVPMWFLPFVMNMKFKMLNTFVLSGSIYGISNLMFRSGNFRVNGFSIIITIMLFVAMVLNIFVVIKEMYQKSKRGDQLRPGVKMGYVMAAFGLLIGTVLMTYALIYENLMVNDMHAFNISGDVAFDSVYYSFVTYFTVGYGDMTPVSRLARNISLSQMVFGYIITCLIIPVILVAMQKLINEVHMKKNKKNSERS